MWKRSRDRAGKMKRSVASMKHNVLKPVKVPARYGDTESRGCLRGEPGYGLRRALAKRGHRRQVSALSLIPKRAGGRVKIDRRYSKRLTELSRAGELRDPERAGPCSLICSHGYRFCGRRRRVAGSGRL